jgi:hypothetical protein
VILAAARRASDLLGRIEPEKPEKIPNKIGKPLDNPPDAPVQYRKDGKIPV